MRRFLLIPHLKIHNANAMSSPYTIGFPAMTAWLGAVHALQRKLQQQGFEETTLFRVAVSCHNLDLQTYKGANDFVHSLVGTANPLTKTGDRSAFIEEARCHTEVSLLIELNGLAADDWEAFISAVNEHIPCMKFAGGDVLGCRPASIEQVDEDEPHAIKMLKNKLMLGHVIIERRDLMVTAMHNRSDALDALLDHLKIRHRASIDDEGKVIWTTSRLTKGWLVPIAVGFQGISALGIAQHQRDDATPHRFAESVVTLGEFVMPHRINELDSMLWKYHVDLENNLYLCQTGLNVASIEV